MMTPILCLVVISASSLNMISCFIYFIRRRSAFGLLNHCLYSSKDILDIKLALHGVLCIPAGILLSIVLIVTFQTSIFDSLFILLAPIILYIINRLYWFHYLTYGNLNLIGLMKLYV